MFIKIYQAQLIIPALNFLVNIRHVYIEWHCHDNIDNHGHSISVTDNADIENR